MLMIAYFSCFTTRRGHVDTEIEAVFAKYDKDSDRILNEYELQQMQDDLEGQKVKFYESFWVLYHSLIVMTVGFQYY